MSPSPSPSPVRLRAEDFAIATRCSFETLDEFRAVENELVQLRHDTTTRDIRRRSTTLGQSPTQHPTSSPPFVLATRVQSKFELKTDAAKQNDAIKTPFKAPSEYSFRVESPPARWKAPGTDFVAKFHLPSTQDLRRRTALDQEGFFADHPPPSQFPVSPYTSGSPLAGSGATDFVKSDAPSAPKSAIGSTRSPLGSPTATSPSKPDFQPRVAHTSRKSSNVQLRVETIVDQDGLLPQLQEIRQHQYRDDAPSPHASPFVATFKPAPSLRPIGDHA